MGKRLDKKLQVEIGYLNQRIKDLEFINGYLKKQKEYIRKDIDPDVIHWQSQYIRLKEHSNAWHEYGLRCMEKFHTIKHENNMLRKNNEKMSALLANNGKLEKIAGEEI